MDPTTDRFGLGADEELQLSTLRAGWRYYERVAGRPGGPQALVEWVAAVEAVLDLGVSPARLQDFEGQLRTALAAVTEEAVKATIRTLASAIAPPSTGLATAASRVQALRASKGEAEEPKFEAVEHVATDIGVEFRKARHVSDDLRNAAA